MELRHYVLIVVLILFLVASTQVGADMVDAVKDMLKKK